MNKLAKTFAVAAAAFAFTAAPAWANGDGGCFNKETLQYEPCPGAIDWTGAYAGVHVGYGSGESESLYSGLIAGRSTEFDLDGLALGAQLGYQHHFDNDLVVGIEGDVTKLWNEEQNFYSVGGGNFVGEEAKLETLASLRLRVGFGAEEFMPYVTGGIALAAWSHDLRQSNLAVLSFDVDDTDFGAVVGGGFEWMVAEEVMLGAEGLYYFLDDEAPIASLGIAVPGDKVEIDDMLVGRVRLSYMF